MRTVTFRSVLDELVMLKGYQPSQLDLSASQALTMAKYLERWCRVGWEYSWWPEWTLIEARTPDGNDLIAYEQTGEEKLGEVEGVYASRNGALDGYDRLDYDLTAEGIDLTRTTGAPATPWVRFRKRPPRFTTEAWTQDNSALYEPGYLVYFPATVLTQMAGECYLLEDDWVKQDVPAILKDEIVMGAWSDCLRQDGKYDEARYWEERATAEMHRAWGVAFNQQRK